MLSLDFLSFLLFAFDAAYLGVYGVHEALPELLDGIAGWLDGELAADVAFAAADVACSDGADRCLGDVECGDEVAVAGELAVRCKGLDAGCGPDAPVAPGLLDGVALIVGVCLLPSTHRREYQRQQRRTVRSVLDGLNAVV